MSEPTTAAGRALYGFWRFHQSVAHGVTDVHDLLEDDIVAIENEAAAGARTALQPVIDAAQAVVENWSNPDRQHPGVAEDALIAALDALDEGQP